jgi:endonuclease YncB( thermonuclease family)
VVKILLPRKTPLAVLVLIIFVYLILKIFPSLRERGLEPCEGDCVVYVYDGDTVSVVKEGKKLKVRLYGIDAPERDGQPLGVAAYKRLREKVYNKNITMDVVERDRYGRVVAIVWREGRNINLEMVKEGLAECYREYLKKRRSYGEECLRAEELARTEKNGIWGLATHERPSRYRRSQG